MITSANLKKGCTQIGRGGGGGGDAAAWKSWCLHAALVIVLLCISIEYWDKLWVTKTFSDVAKLDYITLQTKAYFTNQNLEINILQL